MRIFILFFLFFVANSNAGFLKIYPQFSVTQEDHLLKIRGKITNNGNETAYNLKGTLLNNEEIFHIKSISPGSQHEVFKKVSPSQNFPVGYFPLIIKYQDANKKKFSAPFVLNIEGVKKNISPVSLSLSNPPKNNVYSLDREVEVHLIIKNHYSLAQKISLKLIKTQEIFADIFPQNPIELKAHAQKKVRIVLKNKSALRDSVYSNHLVFGNQSFSSHISFSIRVEENSMDFKIPGIVYLLALFLFLITCAGFHFCKQKRKSF